MQVGELTAVADMGYYSAKQFKICADDNITPYVPEALAGSVNTGWLKIKNTLNILVWLIKMNGNKEMYRKRKDLLSIHSEQ